MRLLTRAVQSEPLLRFAGVVIIITGAAYLSWLYTRGLEWKIWWLAVPIALAHGQAYIAALLFLFTVWHHDPSPRPAPLPGRSVDIFIATLNETYAVLAPVVAGAREVRYPHETYVLDDGNREWVGDLCRQAGVHWVTRHDGLPGKGHNLRNGMANSTGEFIVTLDADFVPAPWVIDDLIGHFADPDVALVQGPQIYYNTNSFQHARENSDWNEQTMFYHVVQPGKNHWNASFWCGTPAMLRRSAVNAVGGIATDSVTEDLATTVALHQAGWRSVYHDGLVAVGLAPEDYSRFFRQRLRWTRGGIQTFRRYLFRPGLTKAQRLSYFATMGRPWDVIRQLILYAALPAMLITREIPIRPEPGFFSIFAVAQVTLLVGSIALGRGTYRVVRAQIYDILSMAAGLTALRAFWERGGRRFMVTPKGRDGIGAGAWPPLAWVLAMTVVYLVAIGFGIAWVASPGARDAATWLLAWASLMAVLFVVCAFFALLHGREAWRGVRTAMPGTLTADASVIEVSVERLAVDRAELISPVSLAPRRAVELSIPGLKSPVAGTVEALVAMAGAWRVTLTFDKAPLDLASIVATELFGARAPVGRPGPVEVQVPGSAGSGR